MGSGRCRAGTRKAHATARWPRSRRTTSRISKVAWTFSTGFARGFEGQPLVVNNTMYIVSPYPNTVFALDLTHQGGPGEVDLPARRPRQRRRARRAATSSIAAPRSDRQDRLQPPRQSHRRARRRHRQGGVGYAARLDRGGRHHDNGAPYRRRTWYWSATAGPNSACMAGSPAWISPTGKVLWRAYNTGPDSVVKIGPELQALLPAVQRRRDLGVQHLARRSMEARRRHRVGVGHVRSRARTRSTTGRANPGVWNPDMRPGDNLWARHHLCARPRDRQCALGLPDDAARFVGLRWRQRVDPRRHHDRRAARGRSSCTSIATDLRTRSIGRPEQVLVAQPYQDVNWATGVDLEDRLAAQGGQQGDASRRQHQGHLSVVHRRPRSAARGLFAAHGVVLHADDEPVHGLRGDEGELHRRHALPRRRRAHVCGPQRVEPARGIHRVERRPPARRCGASQSDSQYGADLS